MVGIDPSKDEEVPADRSCREMFGSNRGQRCAADARVDSAESPAWVGDHDQVCRRGCRRLSWCPRDHLTMPGVLDSHSPRRGTSRPKRID